MSEYIKREDEEHGVGYVGIDKDYFVSVKEVLNITAETGALETQDRVKDLLPADVVEVRHGRWILYQPNSWHLDWRDSLFECSVCRMNRIRRTGEILNYCPNCGAKMDGKEQENEQG